MNILQQLTFVLLYNFCMTLSIKLRLVEDQPPSANQIIESSHVICINGTCKNESVYNQQSLITPNGVIQLQDTTDKNKESGKRGLAFHPSVIGVSTVVIMYIVFLLLYYLFYTRKTQKHSSPSSASLSKPGQSQPAPHTSESSDSDQGDNTEMIVINGEKVTTGRSGKNLWLTTDDIKQQRQMTCVTKLDSSEPGRTQTCVRPKVQGGVTGVSSQINLTMQPDRVQRAVISHQVSSESKHHKLQCPVIYIDDDYQTICDDNSIFSPMASSSTKDLFKSVTKNPLMNYLSLPLDGEEAAALTLTPSKTHSIKRKLSYVKACDDSDDNSQSSSKCCTPSDDHIAGQLLAADNNDALCTLSDNQLASVLTISRRLSYRNACDEEDEDLEDVQSNNSAIEQSNNAFNDTSVLSESIAQSNNIFNDRTIVSHNTFPDNHIVPQLGCAGTLSIQVPQLVILPNQNNSINKNQCSAGSLQTAGNSSSLTLDIPDITISTEGSTSDATLSPENRVRKLSYYKACTTDEMTRYG